MQRKKTFRRERHLFQSVHLLVNSHQRSTQTNKLWLELKTMRIGTKYFTSFGLGALLTGCIYPGPDFERASDSGITIEGQAVLHAYYELSDPIGIIPSSATWMVTEVDGEQWTQNMLEATDNRIALDPGLHWIRMEEDHTGDPFSPVYVGFELAAAAGYEYELVSGPGCLITVQDDDVQRRVIRLQITATEQQPRELAVPGLCTRSKRAKTCRNQKDCDEDLSCVIPGNSGFGFCGIPD